MAHRLAPAAESDLDDIWYYVADGSGNPDIADRFIDRITSAFVTLAHFPHLGCRRDQDFAPGLRTFPVGEYVIVYRLEDEDVLILHVFRGGRDIDSLLRE